MNKPLSDESLERLLSDYGQIPPPTVFTYQPKSPAGFSMKRLAALSVAALLSLLILGLTAGIIAHFATDIPNLHYPSDSIPPALQNTTSTFPSPDRTTVSTTQGAVPPTTSDIKSPDVTDPPVDPPIDPPVDPPVDPPITQPPLPSLLPAWYNGTSIRLVNLLTTSTLSPPFTPQELKEIYNDYASYDIDMGVGKYRFVSADLILLSTHPKGHQDGTCNVVYLRPSNGELICLRHELQELWASVDIDASIVWSLSILHASENGNRYLFYARAEGSSLGTFLYDRTTNTLTELPIDYYTADRLDFISYSPDCNYVMMAMYRQDDDMLDDLFLIDLNTMEVKQICADYPTFGESTFSADERYVYTHLRIGDSVDNNENGQWVLYDTQTGFTFQGEGEVLYLENGILVSRTPNGFVSYDCATGEPPEDLSTLPLVIDADFNNYRYTITVYNPATGKIEKTIPSVGTYELRGQILYYYVHKAEGVVIANLTTGESVSLPVSAALLTGANPAEGYTIYSLAVSGDGSTVSLGYTISMNDYYKQKQKDIDALLALIQDSALKTNNLPDFWEYFRARRAPYEYLIEYTDYDIHEGYVILQISFIRSVRDDKDTWNLHLVEDYRDGTVTLYNASDNPYHVGNIHARSAYETKVQTFRRTLKKGDYEASCALLPTIGELRPFYVDYARCYDENGKWSEKLAATAECNYELLKQHVASANVNYTPEGLDVTLEILSRNPVSSVLHLDQIGCRRVADIQLYSSDKVLIFQTFIYVSPKGEYYLWGWILSERGCQISEADYLALMEAQGGFLVETGLYKDVRLAKVPESSSVYVDADFLPLGLLPVPSPITYNYEEQAAAAKALSMIREGGHDTREIIETLFYYHHAYDYIYLLAEYNVNRSWYYSFRGIEPIRITIQDGVITLSDPKADMQ